MTDITIPPEALEAFLREVETHKENISGEAARAAILAALKAWPGVLVDRRDWPECHLMVLPLPQETSE